MDTLTHIVLGACIGEVIAGKQLGKKALFIGAFANSVPDLDFAASFWLPATANLLAHRGFTHSFLFLSLFAPVFALLSGLFFRKHKLTISRWLFFWSVQLFVHLFIDAFNAYGTGWFEPFSHTRVSFNTLFVADPLFSIGPGLAFLALLLLKKASGKRQLWARTGLLLCSIYLLLGLAFKAYINIRVTKDLEGRQLSYHRYFTTPTPLNILLWYFVAETDSGFFIGYRSVLDKTGYSNLHFDYRNDSLLIPFRDNDDLHRLVRFSEGYHTASFWHDSLVFNDLRFGEITGWAEPCPKFVFHYFLQYPAGNKMLVQRGRFAGWNSAAVRVFLQRMAGN